MLNRNLFAVGKTVAVALSGGKDSMCLLSLLLSQKESLGINVKAVNVEHGIRGISSVADSKFVKNYCEKLGIPIFFKQVDAVSFSKANGLSLEEGARILRYEVFNDAVNGGFCDLVATAHHLSDKVETVFFNLFRGSSASGASGIGEVSADKKIIRPLLGVSRSQIDEYVEKNNVPFVTDETNSDSAYTRNFIRNEVFPLVRERFPFFEKNIARFADSTRLDDEFLRSLADKALTSDGDEFSFSTQEPIPVASRCVVAAMKRLGVSKDYEKKHVDETLGLISKPNGSSIDLPKNIKAIREYDRITVYKDRPIQTFSEPFALKTYSFENSLVSFDLTNDMTLKSTNNRLIADFSKFPQDCIVRTRLPRDVFEKFGGGSKKLKDYLIDKKIPRRLRDRLLLVCKGEKVLVICGIEISDAVKVDKDTTNALQCTYSRKR